MDIRSTTRPTVVLVEEEPVFRRVLALTLGPGFDIVETEGRNDTLARLRAQRPSLVVADLTTPGHRDHRLIADMQTDPGLRGLRTLVFCNRHGRADGQQSDHCQADAVFRKPFRPTRFLQEVERLCSLAETNCAA